MGANKTSNAPLLQCTQHMCPIRVHWHVKLNYAAYWRVKISITNFNYRLNYSQWTLVVQHPNLSNVTQVFSFNYKPLMPYKSTSKPNKILKKFLKHRKISETHMLYLVQILEIVLATLASLTL